MAYSAAILARAKARLAAAREQNAQDDAARIGAIYERLPRLRQIDLELQKTAAKVCAAAFRAGEDLSETIRQLKDENLRLQQERDWILSPKASIPTIWSRPPSARAAAGAAISARGCANVWRNSAGRSRRKSFPRCSARAARASIASGWTTIRRNMTPTSEPVRAKL